jgi:hypothetical protein
MYLFGLIMDKRGNGNNNVNNAIVEKEDPVGVKLTALAKSNGKYILKKDRRDTKATRVALPYNT